MSSDAPYQVWFGNFSDSIICARCNITDYTISADKLSSLNEYSRRVAQSNNKSSEDDPQHGLGAIGLSYFKENDSSSVSPESAYATELINAGFQDINPGEVIKISVQSPSKKHFVSLLHDDTVMRSKWLLEDLQVVISESGNVTTSPTVELDLMPDKDNLYAPTFFDSVKEAMSSFQKLHSAVNSKDGIITKKADTLVMQASLELRATNAAVSELLTTIVQQWLHGDVKLVYRTGVSPWDFKVKEKVITDKLQIIAQNALTISDCFTCAETWYTHVQSAVRKAQAHIYVNLGHKLDDMTASLQEITKEIVAKHLLSESYQTTVDKLHDEAVKMEAMYAGNQKEVEDLVDRIVEFDISLTKGLNAVVSTALKDYNESQRKFKLSLLSWLGGPLFGIIFTAIYGSLRDKAWWRYEADQKMANKAIAEAEHVSAAHDAIVEIANLTGHLDKIISFSRLMSAWFMNKHGLFLNWGTKKSTAVENMEAQQSKYAEIKNLGAKDFLEQLRGGANDLYGRCAARIQHRLEKEVNWKAEKLMLLSDEDLQIQITEWGIHGDDKKDMYDFLTDQLFDGITVDKPWTRFSREEFLREAENERKLKKYVHTFKDYLFTKEDDRWSGKMLVDWDEEKLNIIFNQKDSDGPVATDMVSFYLKKYVMRATVMDIRTVDYAYWEEGYEGDVAWLNNREHEITLLTKNLNKLIMTDIVDMSGVKVTAPDNNLYPECELYNVTFSVPEKAKPFM